ncbi:MULTISPECIES: ABC transporter permease [Mesotoga]|uniref:ABC-type Fe3+ transport system, permease component n=1 Tax=Mesotoga prima MesG1.Ag.4.2 TaxID=660470 RepID=I2F4V5_9BACT|nr:MULTISPECIES: iron ABC transporter permease [Mesotoga]MCP5457396.1 iron ABC transporter permease [Thermotogota bacterium]CCU83593.1 Binding-protein-dependent transport systems inner membrane component [Mesotoga infera]AFK06958.1 ABC-type Fe3+ transport system, permease component [Mesotoga prima MesG1.Ag.4.2]RLL86007.1 ABC transporter permease [Mesotoga sp. H07pep.5.4]HNQ71216.1 iron ABC transporter permease [Mesotoga prima]
MPLFLAFGNLNFETIFSVVSSPSFKSIAGFTVKQSLLSTLLAMIVGFPAAVHYARSSGRLSSLLGITTYIPFFFPSISMAIGFLSVYGRNGIFNNFLSSLGFERVQILYSLGAVLLGHVFYNAPIVILVLGNALRKLPSDVLESSKIDGSGRIMRLLRVELPLVTPAIINSALLIFTYCFTSFAVVLILGGAQFATLEVSIYMNFRLLAAPQNAVVLAVVQFIFIMLFGLLISASEKSATFEQGEQYKEKNRFTAIYSWTFLLFEWLPILGALLSSFYDWTRGEFIFSRISKLFGEKLVLIGAGLTNTLINSLTLSALAALVTVTIAFLLSWQARKTIKGSKQLRIISLIALSVTPSILAVSYLTVFGGFPVPILILLLYIVISLPVVLNYISGQVIGAELNFLEAAQIDGASKIERLRYMIIPFFRSTIIYAATVVFAISMGEFGGSLILGSKDFPTFAVAIYRLNGSRYLLEARFLSSALGIIIISVVSVSRWFAQKPERSIRNTG